MNYEEFKELMREAMLLVLGDVAVEINQEMDGDRLAVIFPERPDIGVAVRLRDLYEEFKACKDIAYIIKKMVILVLKGSRYNLDGVRERTYDAEYIKKNIYSKVIPIQPNKKLLSQVLHRKLTADLAVIYTVWLNSFDDKVLKTNFTPDMLNMDGMVSEDKLHRIACKNTKEKFPVKLGKVTVLNYPPIFLNYKNKMIEAKNSGDYEGGIFIDEELLQKLLKSLGIFYIIPASKTQSFVIAKNEICDTDAYLIIDHINNRINKKQDILSYSIYEYDGNSINTVPRV